MKVISKGKGWKLKKACKGCEAVLEIEQEDLNYAVTDLDIKLHQYDNDIEGTFYVDCPECGQRLEIKPKDIPTIIKSKIT